VANRLNRLGAALYRSPVERRVEPWFRQRGDKTFRVEYDLDQDSVVLDLGGYEGQWASDIFARYCCRVHVFEPVPEYAAAIRKRFAKNPKVRVHAVCLAAHDGTGEIVLSQDGSSLFRAGARGVPVALVEATAFLARHGINGISLMKINIEGGEYDLLEHLIATGTVGAIRDIQVQFHDFVPHAEERMRAIQQKLAETHALTYQFPFVWENWRRKETRTEVVPAEGRIVACQS
jgi:FkbM family methyltransferase